MSEKPAVPQLLTGARSNFEDFVLHDNVDAYPKNLKNRRVTGEVRGLDFPSTMIESVVEDAVFDQIRFPTKDFVESVYRNVLFEKCVFHKGSMTGSVFVNCRFVQCRIELYAIHDCQLYNTEFEGVEFVELMFRHCLAYHTLITDSFTTNQIFKESYLRHCYFQNTPIYSQIIFDNFGVRKSELIPEMLRFRSDETIETYTDLHNERIFERMDFLDQFRLLFFEVSGATFYGAPFDQTFRLTSWAGTKITPLSFTRTLANFAKLVVEEYHENILPFYGVIYLHELLESILAAPGLVDRYPEVATTVQGLLINTADEVAVANGALQALTNQDSKTYAFRTKNGISKREAERILFQIHEQQPYFSYVVRLRNSPLDIFITLQNPQAYLPIFLFLAVNFKVEINKIRDNIERSSESGSSLPGPVGSQDQTDREPIFWLQTGGTVRAPGRLINLGARLGSDKLIELAVTFNSSVLRRVRDVLYRIDPSSDNHDDHADDGADQEQPHENNSVEEPSEDHDGHHGDAAGGPDDAGKDESG